MRTTSIPPMIGLSLLLSLATHVASAVPSAGAKASGQYNLSYHANSAHSSFRSAREHVEHYSDYLRDAHGVAPSTAVQPASNERPAAPVAAGTATATAAAPAKASASVNRDVALEASDTIGAYIGKLGRHLGKMRKHAEAIKDTESLELLDDVERQLGEAKTHHAALHEHHSGETIDAKTAMQHCEKINAALAKAHDEHDKLMKRLGDDDRQP